MSNTWASFHRRVSGIAFNYEELFSDAVFKFLKVKAKSIGSSVGYLLPSLMTATSFLLANSDTTGDVQLFCNLWSGESASYHFATEATREIESNTAFSLPGSTKFKTQLC